MPGPNGVHGRRLAVGAGVRWERVRMSGTERRCSRVLQFVGRRVFAKMCSHGVMELADPNRLVGDGVQGVGGSNPLAPTSFTSCRFEQEVEGRTCGDDETCVVEHHVQRGDLRDHPFFRDAERAVTMVCHVSASRPVRCNALLDRWTFPIPAPAPGTPQPDPEPPQMRTPHRPPLSP